METKIETLKRINASLKLKLAGLLPKSGKIPTIIDGLYLYRRDADVRIECFGGPCVGIIIQGAKRALIANEEYRYSEESYIATGLDLPSVVHVIGATRETPHLALAVSLDRYILNQLAGDLKGLPYGVSYKGVTVGEVTAEMLDACRRLINLLDAPQRIPVLAPMIIRELHYYLLIGPQGDDFRLLGALETSSNGMAQAVSALRERYNERLNVKELADMANMSPPSFYKHFKRFTGLSPLQYQKNLRLYEAQLLMLSENLTAEMAANKVGYDSVSQFSREYKRQFGETPHKDIKRLRNSVTVANGEIISKD
jgi:AraC-like DNA-binding protein